MAGAAGRRAPGVAESIRSRSPERAGPSHCTPDADPEPVGGGGRIRLGDPRRRAAGRGSTGCLGFHRHLPMHRRAGDRHGVVSGVGILELVRRKLCPDAGSDLQWEPLPVAQDSLFAEAVFRAGHRAGQAGHHHRCTAAEHRPRRVAHPGAQWQPGDARPRLSDPKRKRGLLLLTQQGNALGDYGLGVEETRDRNRALLSITSPVVRELHNYRICDSRISVAGSAARFQGG